MLKMRCNQFQILILITVLCSCTGLNPEGDSSARREYGEDLKLRRQSEFTTAPAVNDDANHASEPYLNSRQRRHIVPAPRPVYTGVPIPLINTVPIVSSVPVVTTYSVYPAISTLQTYPAYATGYGYGGYGGGGLIGTGAGFGRFHQSYRAKGFGIAPFNGAFLG